jgi:hypothetical protein
MRFREAGQAARVRCDPGALVARERPLGTARKRAIAARAREKTENTAGNGQKGDFESDATFGAREALKSPLIVC